MSPGPQRYARVLALAAGLALTGCGLPPSSSFEPTMQASYGPLDTPPVEQAPAATGSPDLTPRMGDPGGRTFQSDPFPLTDQAGGAPSDPLNVIVVGDQAQVTQLVMRAGWVVPDKLSAETAAHFVEAWITHSHYPNAPVSSQQLFGRIQDVAFEKNCITVSSRDHFRMWMSNLTDRSGRPVWALCCTRDARIGLTYTDHMPNHIIDPNVDAERDLVASDITSSGQVADAYELVGLGAGYHGHAAGGDPYYTDGMVRVLELSPAQK